MLIIFRLSQKSNESLIQFIIIISTKLISGRRHLSSYKISSQTHTHTPVKGIAKFAPKMIAWAVRGWYDSFSIQCHLNFVEWFKCALAAQGKISPSTPSLIYFKFMNFQAELLRPFISLLLWLQDGIVKINDAKDTLPWNMYSWCTYYSFIRFKVVRFDGRACRQRNTSIQSSALQSNRIRVRVFCVRPQRASNIAYGHGPFSMVYEIAFFSSSLASIFFIIEIFVSNGATISSAIGFFAPYSNSTK